MKTITDHELSKIVDAWENKMPDDIGIKTAFAAGFRAGENYKKKKKSYSKPLTWDELADEYGKLFPNNPPARIQKMGKIFKVMSKQKGFKVNKKEGTIHKKNNL